MYHELRKRGTSLPIPWTSAGITTPVKPSAGVSGLRDVIVLSDPDEPVRPRRKSVTNRMFSGGGMPPHGGRIVRICHARAFGAETESGSENSGITPINCMRQLCQKNSLNGNQMLFCDRRAIVI